jgi:hypothetical protein
MYTFPLLLLDTFIKFESFINSHSIEALSGVKMLHFLRKVMGLDMALSRTSIGTTVVGTSMIGVAAISFSFSGT